MGIISMTSLSKSPVESMLRDSMAKPSTLDIHKIYADMFMPFLDVLTDSKASIE